MPKFVFLLAIGLSISSRTTFAVCTPISGADQIWSNKQIHWVFVGEDHGSNETPAAFLDLVCDALAHGKSVTVALERPTSEQAALDGVVVARNLAEAQQTLLEQPDWKKGMDGRASKAMLRLLFSLRELRMVHPDLTVAAFDTPFKSGDDPGARDEAMGRAVLALGKAHPDRLVLILCGNIHAMQAPMFGHNVAAMYIPMEKRLSLEVTDLGGESWTESNGGCGPTRGGVKEKGQTSPRGIYLDPTLAPYGKVDGILALGVPLSASEPAAGDPDPLPDCRKKFVSALSGAEK
jgi:hypothetical protein